MNFLICGSGASEGIPALFCPCEICMKARARGGKEVRSRTAYQFGEAVRIDFGPDLFLQQMRHGLRLDLLEHLFVTHGHKDHFTPLNLIYRRPQYVHLEKTLFLHAEVELLHEAEEVLKANHSDFGECKIEPVEIEFFREVKVGEGTEEMTFTPIPSDHLPAGRTCIYDVKYGEKRVFVGTDSGIYPDETWEYLQGKRFDVVVMDGTSGVLGLRHVHMGRECVVETVQRLMKMGVCGEDTLVVVNHFSHNGKMNHDDLERFYNPHRIQVGFDGMSVAFENNQGPLVFPSGNA